MSTLMAYQVRPDEDEWEEVELVHRLDGGLCRVRRTPNGNTFVVPARRLGSMDEPTMINAVNRTRRKRAAKAQAGGRGVLRTRQAQQIRAGDVILGRVGMPRLPVDFTVAKVSTVEMTGMVAFTCSATGHQPLYVSPGTVFVVEVRS